MNSRPAAFAPFVLLTAALLISACAGDAKSHAAPPAATRDLTTPASPPVRAGEVEVTGIVASVDADAASIAINRLSGANARTITVDERTTIRRATGGNLSLAQIRPSDRIIATGVLDAGARSLLAREIEVGAIGNAGAGG